MLGGIFYFYSSFNITLCKQTVETLIRRLVWVCTFCICPTKRTLGVYGLITWFKEMPSRIVCDFNKIFLIAIALPLNNLHTCISTACLLSSYGSFRLSSVDASPSIGLIKLIDCLLVGEPKWHIVQKRTFFCTRKVYG